MVPVEVPCTSTDAPINGSLAASVTVPVTVFVCAKADAEASSRQTSVRLLARVTKETNEIQKRFWKKEGMVDFNTKREVTVEKSQARTGVVRA